MARLSPLPVVVLLAVTIVASACQGTSAASPRPTTPPSPVSASASAVSSPSPVEPTRSAPAATRAAPTPPPFLVAEIVVGRHPGFLVEGYGAVWVGNHHGDSVSRIDPATNAVTATISVPGEPVGMTAGAGSVWTFTPIDRAVKRIDPGTGTVVAIPVEVSDGPITGLVEADGAMFLAGGDRRLTRIDPATNTVTARSEPIPDAGCPGSLTVTADLIWHVPECGGRTLRGFDARSLEVVTEIPISGDSAAVWAGLDRLWVVTHRGDLMEIDPIERQVVREASVGRAAEQVRTGHGLVWVRVDADELVSVDPATMAVAEIYPLPPAPIPGGGIAIGEDAVWAVNFERNTVWRLEP